MWHPLQAMNTTPKIEHLHSLNTRWDWTYRLNCWVHTLAFDPSNTLDHSTKRTHSTLPPRGQDTQHRHADQYSKKDEDQAFPQSELMK